MTLQDCLDLLFDVKSVSMATVDENGAPQVRIIDLMLNENDTLYFCTARGKDFYRQLMRTGRVAMTAMNDHWQTVRLSGRVKRLDDQTYWIDRIFDANAPIANLYKGDRRYVLEAFCLATADVEFFDLSTEPIDRASFSLGGAFIAAKGFHITDACIGCGQCAGVCPQSCITPGTPYAIDPDHCLHCGLCAETCPAGAIERLGEQ